MFFFYSSGDPRDLHSFPTRRSSDLARSCCRSPTCKSATPAWCCSCDRISASTRARPRCARCASATGSRSEEHTSELQSHSDLVCRLLLEKKKKKQKHLTVSSTHIWY